MVTRTAFLRSVMPDGNAAERRAASSGFSQLLEAAQAQTGVVARNIRGDAPNPMWATNVTTQVPTAVTSHSPAAGAAGSVADFDSWFQNTEMCAPQSIGGSYTMRRSLCASEQGLAEALRLVRQYAPDSTVATDEYGGPWRTDKPIYEIVLPGGEKMNAGAVLDRYYQHGTGPHAMSESDLESEIRLLTGARA